jgi:glucosyl-3-phosphoglycerate synthase
MRLSVLVDKWFAENTFHSTEFADLEHLVELKREQGVTISLGLPALNEEETIGRIIEVVKGTLQERYPLLDEIVLIDSNSTDYTREIARSLGIPVYIHQEILADEVGSHAGKGEALWKSLYVLNGDIIVWIDTDISNIHPRFVYGIIGPLLLNPRIKYVKGFYRRPLRVGNRIQAGGGGRVTELVARPMFNLFFPRLSGLVQPLSGEYAGRRELLERLPFFTGYGVETGLLIDILAREGLWAIAQSDLIERIHRNQSLSSLSRMAHAIIQVFIARLEDRHKIELVSDINKSMKLIRLKDRHYFLEEVDIIERERPPMIEIPSYRRKRGILDDEIAVGKARGNGLER